MDLYRIVDLEGLERELTALVRSSKAPSVFMLTDSNVAPLVTGVLPEAARIVVPAGEGSKSLEGLATVWQALADGGAVRQSLLVNAGGGMVTDLGGFAAATFKRGINFVNVSTTLLGAVDASIGGKTGINFSGLKNEVGAFVWPLTTFICPQLFGTLPQSEWLSGLGELYKTSFICPERAFGERFYEWQEAGFPREGEALEPVLELALEFKKEVTQADPKERGWRRCLNFGHTAGHAFESLLASRGTPVPHGVAVAHGILVELILSDSISRELRNRFYDYARHGLREFPRLAVSCKDVPQLVELMMHDKKNTGDGRVSVVTLPVDPKNPTQKFDKGLLQAGLEAYLDLMG